MFDFGKIYKSLSFICFKMVRSFVFFVGLFVCCLFVVGCSSESDFDDSLMAEGKISLLCNLINESCVDVFQREPVVDVNDRVVTIYTQTDCCADFEILSVEEVEGSVVVMLIERGEFVCKCGADLQRLDLRFNKDVFLDKLRILQFREYSNDTIEVYPNNSFSFVEKR